MCVVAVVSLATQIPWVPWVSVALPVECLPRRLCAHLRRIQERGQFNHWFFVRGLALYEHQAKCGSLSLCPRGALFSLSRTGNSGVCSVRQVPM